ncbi:hypothetical protein F5I97DRAFT_977983 [Phlebopus sp. FC_14]|nr:hypothetical protein F5I97DRAFT_977983 [Phlebopus sp. FC_14]
MTYRAHHDHKRRSQSRSPTYFSQHSSREHSEIIIASWARGDVHHHHHHHHRHHYHHHHRHDASGRSTAQARHAQHTQCNPHDPFSPPTALAPPSLLTAMIGAEIRGHAQAQTQSSRFKPQGSTPRTAFKNKRNTSVRPILVRTELPPSPLSYSYRPRLLR